MRKILVWHQGALGDLILSLPSLHAIKTSRKNHCLHLVSRSDLADMIIRNRIADEATLNEAGIFSDLFTDAGAESPALRDILADADEAFVFMRRQDDAFMKNIRSRIPRTFFIGTVPPEDSGIHVALHQMCQLKSAGINININMPVLDAPDGCLSPPTGKRTVTIHPGSGGRKKCWPLEKFLDLAASLQSVYSPGFRLIFGPAEDHAMMEMTRDYLSRRGIDSSIFSNVSLSEAASLTKSSSLFIGNDSGITHLASALGTPVIALFGPADHRMWGPLGKDVSIVRSSYACSPCGEEKYRLCSRALCMESIGTGKVREAAESLLKKGNIRN